MAVKIKTIEDLESIRASMRDKICLREGFADACVVVGMGTAGIDAGAREVLHALVDAVDKKGLCDRVTVMQSGAVTGEGAPIVEIRKKGADTVVKTNVTPADAEAIVAEAAE